MTWSSVEELKRKLVEDAEKKAEEIIKKAEEEARKIIENAEKEWEERAKSKREEIISRTKRKAQIILSDARTRARMIIGKAKYEVIEKIFEDIEKNIRERREFDVETSLRNLLNDSLKYIGDPVRIVINPRDRDIIENILREKKLGDLEIIVSDKILGGLILIDNEGKKVDNTYNTRLDRARNVLIPLINRELWG